MTSSSCSASSTSSPAKRRRSNPTEKDIKDVVNLSSYVAFGNKDHLHAAKDSAKQKKAPLVTSDEMKTEERTDRPGGAGHKKVFGIGRRRKASAFDDASVLTFANYIGGNTIPKKRNKQGNDPPKMTVTFDEDAKEGDSCVVSKGMAAYGCSDYDPMEEIDNAKELMFVDENMKEIHRLAGPWIFGSIIGQMADIATVALVSFYIGNDSMIAYITIEFLLSMLQLLSYGIYDACYKLANIAISSGDEDRAGKIAKVSICLSVLTSLPALIVSIFWMEDILLFFGYGRFIRNIGPKYAILSSLMSLVSSISSIVSALVDLNDGANFNAVFDFWDSVVGLILTFVAAAYLQLSLIGLGVLWLVCDLVSAAWYVYEVGRRDLLKPFFEGTRPFSFLQSRGSLKLASLVLHTSLPLTMISVASDLEFRVISFMASELGAAEAATWILLSYVWALMESMFDSFASAAATQVNTLLTRGEVVEARRTSRKTRAFALLYGVSVALIVYATKDPIANLLTSDYTLQSMLVDGITYACVGVPFTAIGGISEEMNKEQGRYRTSMAISWCCTLVVTLPCATVFTYGFRFSIAGVVSAVVMGSTTDGMLQTVLLVYSNFHSASNSLQHHAHDDLSTVDEVV
eukprot:CAMPEP_0181023926 /NCGR_PEP_ID=MMETSP1070-20121207/2303_1 /TAXON_ID=265543 /ORGANISM="Minutocellus polymorphus, Strain NH13" /LENGTH=629 /DNA_ID=CAMNT_0023100957 /DNA_START=37 /DNA_END=1926 /DNA_ORIENTATION=-